jgi:Anti-sigma-K factor rskA
MTEAVRLDDHDRFRELSALANAGVLSSAQWAELKGHLQFCEQCREIHDQYRLLAREGIPGLAAVHSSGQEEREWDDTATRRRLLARIRREDRRWFIPAAMQLHLGLRHRYNALSGAVFAACLTLVVAGGAYHMGSRIQSNSKRWSASEDRFRALLTEKSSVKEQLGLQAGQILRLQEESSRKEQELAKLRLALRTTSDHANDMAAGKMRADEQMRIISEQRDALSARLREAEQVNQSIQAELASLRAERDRVQLRMVSLESKIDELTAANREQERKLKDDEQYLASDRDIRELMGARRLYIADVFDVDSRSRTRKSFGRVFYTQGKSLVFYAFDLDPGVKNVNAFQVWGRKEMAQGTQATPKSLGILYLDNESNRRWVMRFDDPKQLAEIDAVFVTVEPQGGSAKPTSKPFLYALLRKEVNHP